MRSKFLSIITIATGATLLAAVPAMAQESEDTNPYGYDRSFITRPDYKKPNNPFAAKAEDFSKNSYRRMLLNSEFATSSGLGIGNNFYNQDAYTYMNPDSFKANDATPEEVNRYIDQVYAPATKGGVENQSYQPNKNFDQPNPFKSNTKEQLSETNPFGTTFDNSPESPFMQKDPKRPTRGKSGAPYFLRKPSTPGTDGQQDPADSQVDTSQSNF